MMTKDMEQAWLEYCFKWMDEGVAPKGPHMSLKHCLVPMALVMMVMSLRQP